MTRSIPQRLGIAATAAAGVLLLGACSLDVSTPDIVRPESTAGVAALPTLLAGASGDFSVAYSGFYDTNNPEGLIITTGLFADEFIATDYFTTHNELDTRRVNPTNDVISRVSRNIMRAIVNSQTTADRFAEFAPDDAGHARALNFVGYGHVFIAENFCSGVPFSTINPDGTPNYGDPKSTVEILNAAITKFDAARQVATTAEDDLQRYTAMVGKGRALLDLGSYAAAAQAVAGVPTNFRFTTEHGAVNDREKNGVYTLTFVNSRMTQADVEGGNGLPFISSGDPRTPAVRKGKSKFDAGTPLFPPLKYNSYEAKEVIADGIEARLIEAEAALKVGNYGGVNGTLAILNTLRTDAGLSALPAVTDPVAREDQLFDERAYWMFGTAHRMSDLRRLVRQYQRRQEDVFPSGDYFKGSSYGTQVALPVPQEEENNPKFSRAACNTNAA
jgi:hypothetical protein